MGRRKPKRSSKRKGPQQAEDGSSGKPQSSREQSSPAKPELFRRWLSVWSLVGAVALLVFAAALVAVRTWRHEVPDSPEAVSAGSTTPASARTGSSLPEEVPELPAGLEPLAPVEHETRVRTFVRARNPRDGAVLVWVPPTAELSGPAMRAGAFLMGSVKGQGFTNELPQHEVELSGFWLYQCEVTRAQFLRFAKAILGGGAEDLELGAGERQELAALRRKLEGEPSSAQHPAMGMSWALAAAYARWANCELPTEAQWEWAARGPSGRRYPWGDEWDAQKCCTKENQGTPTFPVGSFPAGASWCGVLDLAGNVWEWCSDRYAEQYSSSRQVNPRGPRNGTARVVRGGFWLTEQHVSRSACRMGLPPDTKKDGVGFRCAFRPTGP